MDHVPYDRSVADAGLQDNQSIEIAFVPLVLASTFIFAGIYSREQERTTLNAKTFQDILEKYRPNANARPENGVVELQWRVAKMVTRHFTLFHLDSEQDVPLVFGGKARQSIIESLGRKTRGGCFPVWSDESKYSASRSDISVTNLHPSSAKNEQFEREAAERQRRQMAQQKLINQTKALEQAAMHYGKSHQQQGQQQQSAIGPGNPTNTSP